MKHLPSKQKIVSSSLTILIKEYDVKKDEMFWNADSNVQIVPVYGMVIPKEEPKKEENNKIGFVDKHPILVVTLGLFLIMFTFFFTLYLVGGVTLKEALGVSLIHTIFLECMGVMYISLLSLHDE